MISPSDHDEVHAECVCLYALGALPADESSAIDAQIAACAECRTELHALLPIVGSFVSWPADVLRPPRCLWDSVAERIAAETGQPPATAPVRPPESPRWEEVAPGISVVLLATDAERQRVSMLVRLAPGADYPPHRHAGAEELHLLDGELIIDERTLHPGDYSRAAAGSVDRRVRSETGCTCVLVTSPADVLG